MADRKDSGNGLRNAPPMTTISAAAVKALRDRTNQPMMDCKAALTEAGGVGVRVQVEGARADPQVLRDGCMHVTARNPVAGRREDIAREVLDKETEIARAQMAADPRNANKPPAIQEKILEGKIKTWLA